MYATTIYSLDPVVISFLRIWRVETSASSEGLGLVAFSNNRRPTTSDMAITRDDTVTPSRRFFLNPMHEHQVKSDRMRKSNSPFSSGFGNHFSKVP